MCMAHIVLFGRLGRDAEVRATANKKKFVSFSLAVDEKQLDNTTKTDWYSITSYQEGHCGKLVDYLKSGKLVMVSGNLRPGVFVGKDGITRLSLNVTATDIQFPNVGKKTERETSSETPTATATQTPTPAPIATAPTQNYTQAQLDAFNNTEASEDLPF